METLVRNFRSTKEKARDEGAFHGDLSFRKFLHGCRGDASDLLAQCLLEIAFRRGVSMAIITRRVGLKKKPGKGYNPRGG